MKWENFVIRWRERQLWVGKRGNGRTCGVLPNGEFDGLLEVVGGAEEMEFDEAGNLGELKFESQAAPVGSH